jgi:hypothetical protein
MGRCDGPLPGASSGEQQSGIDPRQPQRNGLRTSRRGLAQTKRPPSTEGLTRAPGCRGSEAGAGRHRPPPAVLNDEPGPATSGWGDLMLDRRSPLPLGGWLADSGRNIGVGSGRSSEAASTRNTVARSGGPDRIPAPRAWRRRRPRYTRSPRRCSERGAGRTATAIGRGDYKILEISSMRRRTR